MATNTDGKASEEVGIDEGIGLELARATLGDLVLRAGFGNERIVLTRKGKQTAALIGMKDLKRLLELDAAMNSATSAAA